MSSRSVREHLRSNVIGYLCLFWLLAGSAVAAQSLPKNSVTSKAIRNGQVRTADIGPGAITSPKVRDDSLTGADIVESSLHGVPGDGAGTGPAGGDLSGSFPNPLLAPSSVGSPEVADGSLTGDDIDESSLGLVPDAAALGGAPAGSYLRTTTQAAGDVSGTFSALSIGAGAVGPAKLAAFPGGRLDGDAHPTAIPSGTGASGCFATTAFLVGGMSGFNSGCGITGLTAPRDGTYMVTGQISWAASAAGTRKFELRRANITVAASEVQPVAEATRGTTQTASTIVRATAGDQFGMLASQSSGGSISITGANLSVAWLGP